MRRAFFFYTLIISVSSAFGQQPLVLNTKHLRKAVPPHYNHDQKDIGQGLDKVARRNKVEPRLPPLKPQPEVPWFQWVHEGRWAAQAEKKTELHQVRARLLAERLKPNQFVFKPHISPQLKPELKQKDDARYRGQAGKRKIETIQKEPKGHVRRKRDAVMSQAEPENNLQPQHEAKFSNDKFADGIAEATEKREKRQIVYFINRPPQLLARSPRTTPNPFVRDTQVDEYDIIRPEVGEREGMIPTVESGSSDPGSYPLVTEESSEFSKVISQFYLMTSDEHWPEIQRFAENVMQPLAQLTDKKKELVEVLKRVEDTSGKAIEDHFYTVVEQYGTSVNKVVDGAIHNRVKRRVNKTLKRKRAKKKKQRLRRFERKRLRMLTHARRVRRQQKSKQARLARHYARMNMSTTPIPEHLKNQTIGEEEHHEDHTRSKDDEEYEEESDEDDDQDLGDEEYETSEYEDESEESKSESSDKSKGKSSKSSQGDSKESDENKTEESGIGSKPDYGNDEEYEDYDDESDGEYEGFESSEEKPEKKEKKSGKGKKLKTDMKSKRTLQMISRNQYNQGKEKQRNNQKVNLSNGGRPNLQSINVRNKFNHYTSSIRNKEPGLENETPQLHREKSTLNDHHFKVNVANKHQIAGRMV